MKFVITGGIGSGKSTVSRFLAERYNLPLIDVDQICRELFFQGQKGWLAMKECYGDMYFDTNGDIDRVHLRQALFSDDYFRRGVDQLIHPLAREKVVQRMREMNGRCILVEVPLLFEAGWQNLFDRIIVVYANASICCKRIVRRDNVGNKEAYLALSAQKSLEEKSALADYTIDNNFCLIFTKLQLIHLGDGIF